MTPSERVRRCVNPHMAARSVIPNCHDMGDKRDLKFQMRHAASFMEKVDEWRVLQRPIPSRASAIQQLVELGLTVRVRNTKPKGKSK